MEPEAADNHIRIHIKAGETGRKPEVLSCRAEASFRPEQLQKAKEGLVQRGIGKGVFEGSDHLVVLEFSCNPGCEKELAQELERLTTSEESEEAFLCDLIQSWRELGMTFDVVESHNKVYLCAHNNEIREHSETSKVRAFYENVKLPAELRLAVAIEGEKVKTEENEGIDMSYLDVLLEYPSSKDICSTLHKFLQAAGQDFPLVSVLPNLRRANIRYNLSSPEEMARMIGFKISETEVKEIFPNGKMLIQNELRVVYFNAAGFMVEATAKMDHMKFCLSKYFFKAISYLDNVI
jgi:hypothetical protein